MPDGVDEMCKGCQVLEKKLAEANRLRRHWEITSNAHATVLEETQAKLTAAERENWKLREAGTIALQAVHASWDLHASSLRCLDAYNRNEYDKIMPQLDTAKGALRKAGITLAAPSFPGE